MNSFEDIADSLKGVDDKESSRLAKLADFLVKLEARKHDLERDLKVVDEDIRRVQEHEIPALMAELGFKKFTLEDGSEVAVKPYYSASIAKERQDEAFDWLNSNGFGDLIKNVVSTSFGRGQETLAERFANECLSKGYNAATKKWVEPMTLKAFVKEQIEKGDSPPDELFGIYVGQKATIKKGK
jgi:hypothetical protein